MDRIQRTQQKFKELFGGKPTENEGTDPEFMRILQRFIFGEVCYVGSLDIRTRELVTITVLAETGTDNIVCAQPFGCLPNHIAGKGTIRTLKQMSEHENIVAVDYDPSATKVNQENRIKLMLATARENFSQAKGGGKEPSDAEQK